MAKITITEKQRRQFNNMLDLLREISTEYKTPEQFKRDAKRPIDYEYDLKDAYVDIIKKSKLSVKGVTKLFPGKI